MSQTRDYTVHGMTCYHCVLSVTEEVAEVAGVPARRRRPRLRAACVVRGDADDDAVRERGRRGRLRGRAHDRTGEARRLRRDPRGAVRRRRAAGGVLDPGGRRRTRPMAGHGAARSTAERPSAAGTPPSRVAVRGLAVADGRPARRGRAARAAPRPRRALRFRIVDERRRDRARLRGRAREAHAPDPRPARSDRLPAPASRAGRRRHLERAACARRGRLLPAVRRLLARRRGADARHRPARRRHRPTCAPLPGCPRPVASDGGYEVRLDAGEARPGEQADAALRDHARTASRSRPSPTSGAGGHLVALREGDLAFLHVHPDGTRRGRASRRRSRPRAATACSCSSSTRAAVQHRRVHAGGE